MIVKDVITYCESVLGEMTPADETEVKSIELKCSKITVEGVGVFYLRLLRTDVWFYPDRTRIPDGDYYVIRMAQAENEQVLVLRVLDAVKQTYQRVGSGYFTSLRSTISWPDAEIITVV